MWWIGTRGAGLSGSLVIGAVLWWALYATGTLYAVSMIGAFALLVASVVGLDGGQDMRLWCWVMLASLTALFVGVLAL